MGSGPPAPPPPSGSAHGVFVWVFLRRAEHFYVLHSSPYFMLLTICKRVFSIRVENSVDPGQMASSEADLDLQCLQKGPIRLQQRKCKTLEST